MQPAHECLDITGMVYSCYGPYSLLLTYGMLVEEEHMYNRTMYWWLESTYSAARQGKVLFNITGLEEIMPKETVFKFKILF